MASREKRYDNYEYPRGCYPCPKWCTCEVGPMPCFGPYWDMKNERHTEEAATQEDEEMDPEQQYIEERISEHDNEIQFTEWRFDDEMQMWTLKCVMVGGSCLTLSKEIECVGEFHVYDDIDFTPQIAQLSILTRGMLSSTQLEET